MAERLEDLLGRAYYGDDPVAATLGVVLQREAAALEERRKRRERLEEKKLEIRMKMDPTLLRVQAQIERDALREQINNPINQARAEKLKEDIKLIKAKLENVNLQAQKMDMQQRKEKLEYFTRLLKEYTRLTAPIGVEELIDPEAARKRIEDSRKFQETYGTYDKIIEEIKKIQEEFPPTPTTPPPPPPPPPPTPEVEEKKIRFRYKGSIYLGREEDVLKLKDAGYHIEIIRE